jgi:hypothetical protein
MIQIYKPTESFSPKRRGNPSLLPMDETIRPKDSNRIAVDRNSIAPAREELSGDIPSTVSNNTLGSYTQINL